MNLAGFFRQDFRFAMGLRRGSESYFRNRDDDGEILAERARWLDEDASRYAKTIDDAEPALMEARELFEKLHGRGVAPSDATPAALGRVWAPDFLLLRGEGEPVLVAGCVCFPSVWDLGEKMGRPMRGIHGPVPTLNDQLGPKIAAYFEALAPGVVSERWNWGLAATPERNLHPALNWPKLGPTTSLAEAWMRAERQALLRLPKTGAVLFGIRLVITPLLEVLASAEDRRNFANTLESMPAEIAAYKGLASAIDGLTRQARAATE